MIATREFSHKHHKKHRLSIHELCNTERARNQILTRMHEGDKWEVYIPAKWGYGAMKMDDIPAHSTLIFTLQLVKIERL